MQRDQEATYSLMLYVAEGAVFLRQGNVENYVICEMKPGQALRLAEHLKEHARIAIALEREAGRP